MAEENLVCEETSESWISDNYDYDVDAAAGFLNYNNEILRKEFNFIRNRSIPMMRDDDDDDDTGIEEMVEKESDFIPGSDYLKRLRSADFEFRVRNEAMDWIWKVRFLINGCLMSFLRLYLDNICCIEIGL